MNGKRMPPGDDVRLVEERLARLGIAADRPDHDRQGAEVAGVRDEAVQRLVAALDGGGALEKIARGIARQRQLGKDGEIGPGLQRPPAEIDDQTAVALEIPDGRIDLAKGYAQYASWQGDRKTLDCSF